MQLGSLTRKQKEAEEKIKAMIVDGCKRGICNRDGKSVRRADGSYGPAMTFAQKQVLKRRNRGTV